MSNMLVELIIELTLAYLIINLIILLVHNYKAQKFFDRAPNLPLVPNRSLLTGNVPNTLLDGKFYLQLDELHKEYGKSFGFYYLNKPWVATKDLDLIKRIKIDEPQKHINRSRLFIHVDEFDHSLFQVTDDEWRISRKIVSPGLTNHKIKSDEISPGVNRSIERLKKAIDKKIEKNFSESGDKSILIDLDDTNKRFALSVILMIMFKLEDEIDYEADYDLWTADLKHGSKHIVSRTLVLGMIFPFLTPLTKLIFKFTRSGIFARRTKAYVDDNIRMSLEARKNSSGSVQSNGSKVKKSQRRLIDYMVDAYLDRKIPLKSLHAASVLMLPAGSNTTAGVMSSLLWNIVQNSQLQEKLRKIINVEGVEAEYLTWCIYEAMRWCPPVMFGVGRELGDDVEVNGIFYPKGTTVVPSEYSIHKDPETWPEPEKFIPERFKDLSKMHPAAFSQFGLGPRNCVGGNLALNEIRLIVKFYLTNYRLEKCPETPKVYSVSAPGLIWYNLDQQFVVRLRPLGSL